MLVVQGGFVVNLDRMDGFTKRDRARYEILFYNAHEDGFVYFDFDTKEDRNEAHEKILEAYAAGEKILRL